MIKKCTGLMLAAAIVTTSPLFAMDEDLFSDKTQAYTITRGQLQSFKKTPCSDASWSFFHGNRKFQIFCKAPDEVFNLLDENQPITFEWKANHKNFVEFPSFFGWISVTTYDDGVKKFGFGYEDAVNFLHGAPADNVKEVTGVPIQIKELEVPSYLTQFFSFIYS